MQCGNYIGENEWMTFCISFCDLLLPNTNCCRWLFFFSFFRQSKCVSIVKPKVEHTYLLLTGLLNKDDATAWMAWISVIGPSLFRWANTLGILKYAYACAIFDVFGCFMGGSSLFGCRYMPVGTVVTNRGRFGTWSSMPLLLCVASICKLRSHRPDDIEKIRWKWTGERKK